MTAGKLQHQLKADCTAAMMDWLVAWIVRWFAILALLNVLTDVLPSYPLEFIMQVCLLFNI